MRVSRCRTPTPGRYRVRVAEISGAVSVGVVQLRPGDLIGADGTSVCVVPRESAAPAVASSSVATDEGEPVVVRLDRIWRPLR